MYSKKLLEDLEFSQKMEKEVKNYSLYTWSTAAPVLKENTELTFLLLNDNLSPVIGGNKVKILKNGEEKFPEVLAAIEAATHHIHLEYYIFEDDHIGNTIKEALIRKAAQGVQVRFIYDDFGSRSIRKRITKELRKQNIEAYPFHQVKFWPVANRLNYRNHRKIIIIDGQTAFTGGINVGDTYINHTNSTRRYWRDTHLRIDGPGLYYLQYLFLCDWNFCSGQHLLPEQHFFFNQTPLPDNQLVQIAAGGPDSPMPTILYTILQVVNLARREILITTPYFIPGESLLDALMVAAMSGVSVQLLVPGPSDSFFVNTAAKSFYSDLLQAGIKIYRYRKGFIHAKTIVTDTHVSIVGTANMDYRSFELNFEVNTLVYDTDTARQLRELFYQDLKDSEMIDPIQWAQRPWYFQFMEKVLRLLSPLL